MPDVELTPAEIADIFEGEVGPIETNADEIQVSLVLQAIRDHLLEVAEKSRVGVSQLAKRLHISPSAVSRMLRGEGDMMVSTAVLYARALGHQWSFSLVPDSACSLKGNHHSLPDVQFGISDTAMRTSNSPVALILGEAARCSTHVNQQIKVQA